MTYAAALLLVLLACGWAYWALAALAASLWRRRGDASSCSSPPVSILKPVCGPEPDLRANLESFCAQDYPEYEALFVSERDDDPGLAVAREVAERCGPRRALVLSGGPRIGRNLKVCGLEHGLRHASHDIVVVSDSDMRVTPDYLARVVAPFADPSVGVVTCLYRGAAAGGFSSCLEMLGIGADFIPSVLVAWLIQGPRFGLGATLAVRRGPLEACGGFRSLADELADDYRLAEMLRATGAKQVLSGYVVECVLGRGPFGVTWQRRLRWARTVRALSPAGWCGALVTHVTPLAGALVCIHRSGAALAALAATAFWRGLCAAWIAVRTGDRGVLRLLWLLPVSDLVAFVIWVLSFTRRRVTWRGTELEFGPGGRLGS
jgi:ceramide glucosyltransferase